MYRKCNTSTFKKISKALAFYRSCLFSHGKKKCKCLYKNQHTFVLGAGCAKSCIPAHATARAGRGRLSIFQAIGGVYIFIHQLSAANSFSWLYFRRPRAYSPAVYKTRHHLLPSIRPARADVVVSFAFLWSAIRARVITARSARIIFAARLFLHSCEPHNKTFSTERDKAGARAEFSVNYLSAEEWQNKRNCSQGKLQRDESALGRLVFFQQLKAACTHTQSITYSGPFSRVMKCRASLLSAVVYESISTTTCAPRCTPTIWCACGARPAPSNVLFRLLGVFVTRINSRSA